MSATPVTTEPDDLTIALRVYAVRRDADDDKPSAEEQPRRVRRKLRRHLPHRVLVFDTETTTDDSQRLIFGVWRYFVDRHERIPGVVCVEEGIVYADDLPETDPDAYAKLVAYAATKTAAVWPGFPSRIRMLSRSEFVEQILWRYGHKQRATIVGFNLPFDLTRLAIAATTARGRFAGGISLRLSERERFRPRIAYKTIDSKRHLIGFTSPDGDDNDRRFRGHFLDLRTLCFALSDRAGTLEACCTQFGVAFKKRDVQHGSVDENYITYCREDVAATAALFRAAMTEYARHPIELQATKAYSPASIGKAYLRAMRIRPILERQPDFPVDVLGYGMAAFFGGRAEGRIRRWPLPVIYVDFLSMYPTVNALMGSWRLITANHIDVDDVTDHVRRLIASKQLFTRCFSPNLWPELLTLVELEPDGALLPVRAGYDPASADFGIGLNTYWLNGGAWYTLADVVASVILTGRAPRIVRALRLCPVGRQKGMRPVLWRGAIEIDPRRDDFFRTAIEERKRTDADDKLPTEERERLSRSLKVTTNATSYGVLAEYVRHELHQPVGVDVYSDTEFDTTTLTPEDPGEWCFPPLAACITGAARLMLALLQRSIDDAGGSYVLCDTDSMAIVATDVGGLLACPGGPHRLDDAEAVHALSRHEVIAIVDRFADLNPYDRTAVSGSVLKIEAENYNADREWRQLWCWAISSKRYTLYHLDDRGEPVIVKALEHGLGHLLNPTDPDDVSHDWITETWNWLLRRELGLPADEPRWLDRMALSRITISTPGVLAWFKATNEDRPYTDQIKPANFMLVAHPDPLDASGTSPIAPYQSDPTQWPLLSFIDRHTGQPVRTTTDPYDGNPRPGVVRVRTYRNILAAYLAHPEAKSLAPNGRPVGRNTHGLLRARPVRGIRPARYVGKEANRIDDRADGLIDQPDDYRTEYVDPHDRVWRDLVVPVLLTMPRSEVIEQSGLSRRSIERILLHAVHPHPTSRTRLVEIAVEHAATQLNEQEIRAPREPEAVLHRYLHAMATSKPA
jgi:hypothetical protein